MDSLADLMLVERRCTGGHVHDRGSSPVRMQPFGAALSATHKRGVHNVRSHGDLPAHKGSRGSSERRSFTDRTLEIRKEATSAHDVPSESSSLEHLHEPKYVGSATLQRR